MITSPGLAIGISSASLAKISLIYASAVYAITASALNIVVTHFSGT
jgi:hypothetical protein